MEISDKKINIILFFGIVFIIGIIIFGLFFTFKNDNDNKKHCCDIFCEKMGDYYCGDYSQFNKIICKENTIQKYYNETYKLNVEYIYDFKEIKEVCENNMSVIN